MTRIDFYVLQQSEIKDRHHFACRITEKAVNQGNRVMIATRSPDETSTLDDLLWSFRPESFIPHQTNTQGVPTPVLITHAQGDLEHHDLLINLRADIPDEFSRFSRLAEIVINNDDDKQTSREHYRFYADRGYQIQTHKLT